MTFFPFRCSAFAYRSFLISQTGQFTYCRSISPTFPSSPQPSHQFLFASAPGCRISTSSLQNPHHLELLPLKTQPVHHRMPLTSYLPTANIHWCPYVITLSTACASSAPPVARVPALAKEALYA